MKNLNAFRSRKAGVGLAVSIFMSVMLLLGIFHGVVFAAENYPTRAVELLIPYSAGSGTDLLGRVFAKYASPIIGQPIVVTTVTGASGGVAAADIAKSTPDGYKLLILPISFRVVISKMQKIPFNPEIIMPIANFTEEIQGVIVKGDSPWKTFNDLLDFARKNPNKLTWSHAGLGIPCHLDMEIALRKANVKAVSVPYKGTPEALTAVLGGHSLAGSMVYSPIKDQIAAGKVRLLVIWRENRFEGLPNVPNSSELGFPSAGKFSPLFGLYAHKDTPAEIIKFVSEVSKKVDSNPQFKADLNRMGAVSRFMLGSELMKNINEAEAVLIPTLKELGLYKD